MHVYSFRWLLLNFKREFSMEDGIHMFEVLSSQYLELSSDEALRAKHKAVALEFLAEGKHALSTWPRAQGVFKQKMMHACAHCVGVEMRVWGVEWMVAGSQHQMLPPPLFVTTAGSELVIPPTQHWMCLTVLLLLSNVSPCGLVCQTLS